MRGVFDACYAPSTLGSFLRTFSFGHVRQLDAVASPTVIGLAQQTPLLPRIDEYAVAGMDISRTGSGRAAGLDDSIMVTPSRAPGSATPSVVLPALT